MNTLIDIRPVAKDDTNFIISTWLKGARYGNPFFESIDPTLYYKEYGRIVEHYVMNSSIRVACLADEPDVVLGYLVYDPLFIHWVYVKPAFRSQGIATKLAEGLSISMATGYSKPGASIIRKKKLIFNPFQWR